MRFGLVAVLVLNLMVSQAVAADKTEEKAVVAPAAAPSPVEQTIQTVCAACHAADGNSVMAANPKLAGQHPEYLLKQLKEFKEGKRANAVMSGMVANLTEDDMKALAAYFSSQKPTLGKAKSNGRGSLGEKIYRGGILATNVPACAACHGATGSGIPKQFPRLAGQHADYVLQQMRTFRTGERANAPMMQAIAVKMTDQEMQAVADYVQGLR
jgi:cytochrome c553